MYMHFVTIYALCFDRYHYCLRIYNRFNWNKFYSSRWQEEDEAEEERRNFGDLDPNGTSDLKTIVPLKDPRTTRGGTNQEGTV